MLMAVDEFTDTYSDDIAYLREARISLLTHPLRAEIPELCNASFCRMYAIIMIGSIEAMLDRWRDRDNFNILETYFAQDTSNRERLESLRNAFITNSINVKNDVFDDYLAIKYIRNAIVHADWKSKSGRPKQEQLDWITDRKFPTDTRKLTEEHWQKMEWVNENMMFYIALTGMPGIHPRPDLIDVGASPRPLPDRSGIILPSQWPILYWSNLERISATISDQIQAAALTPQHCWAQGMTREEIEALPDREKKRRYYLAAQSAGRNCFEPLISLRGLADNASLCWSEYMRLVPEFQHLDHEPVRSIIKSLRTLHEHKIMPKGGFFPEWSDDIPEVIRNEFIKVSLGTIDVLTLDEVAEAHKLGAIAKRAIRNIIPLTLFSIQLPILVPDRMDEWSTNAAYIADVLEAGQSWYAFVECQASPQGKIDFYREMLSLLSQHK
jgi:hypothetical protein